MNSNAQEKFELWLSGDNWIYANGGLPFRIREYLLSIADNKCSKCGWSEPNTKIGKPILTINHIDGNWKNNRICNLEVLCYNCHTLTETFGSLNMGSISGRRQDMNDRKI